MTKQDLIKDVKTIVEGETTYEGLRNLAKEWLIAQGTPKEKELTTKLLAGLKECVSSIDDTLSFMQSEDAKKIFGADTAKALAQKAQETKDKGEKICFCPSCRAGEEILENASLLA